jgi:hypothetical protein
MSSRLLPGGLSGCVPAWERPSPAAPQLSCRRPAGRVRCVCGLPRPGRGCVARLAYTSELWRREDGIQDRSPWRTSAAGGKGVSCGQRRDAGTHGRRCLTWTARQERASASRGEPCRRGSAARGLVVLQDVLERVQVVFYNVHPDRYGVNASKKVPSGLPNRILHRRRCIIDSLK